MQVEELKKGKAEFITTVNELIRDYELKTKTVITGIDIVKLDSFNIKQSQGYNSYEKEYPIFDTIKLKLDY